MKFTIENNCKKCRIKKDEVQKIYKKMCCIEDNLQKIIEVFFIQFPLDKVSKDWEGQRELLKNNINEILLNIDFAIDEFDLIHNKGSIPIEVVTKDVAEGNDKDFNSDLSIKELKTYEVGGTLSIYTKLTEKYYFRFM